MMAELVERLGHLSLTASAVLLPLLLSTIIQKRYTAKTCYVLWLALAVWLLLPVDWSLPEPAVTITVPEVPQVWTAPAEPVRQVPPATLSMGPATPAPAKCDRRSLRSQRMLRRALAELVSDGEDVNAVTVAALTGLLADGLSTALFVAGEEEAARILEAHYPQAAAVLVREDGTVRILGDLDFTPESAS